MFPSLYPPVLHSLSATTPKPIEEAAVDLSRDKQRLHTATDTSPLEELPTNLAKMQSTKWLPSARRKWTKNRRGRNRRMSEAIGTGVCWQASYFSVTITFSCGKIHFRLTVLHPSETPVARGQASFPPPFSPISSLSSYNHLQVAHYLTRSRFPRSYSSNLLPSTFDWNI